MGLLGRTTAGPQRPTGSLGKRRPTNPVAAGPNCRPRPRPASPTTVDARSRGKRHRPASSLLKPSRRCRRRRSAMCSLAVLRSDGVGEALTAANRARAAAGAAIGLPGQPRACRSAIVSPTPHHIAAWHIDRRQPTQRLLADTVLNGRRWQTHSGRCLGRCLSRSSPTPDAFGRGTEQRPSQWSLPIIRQRFRLPARLTPRRTPPPLAPLLMVLLPVRQLPDAS